MKCDGFNVCAVGPLCSVVALNLHLQFKALYFPSVSFADDPGGSLPIHDTNSVSPGVTLGQFLKEVPKPETHRANRWPSEAFGETRTSSGTNLFGVFSGLGSFREHMNRV